jgi:hypothetical protein
MPLVFLAATNRATIEPNASGGIDEAAERRAEALELRVLLRARALRATAESSEYEAEAEAFTAKATALVERYGIATELLELPSEPLQMAVVTSELRRVKDLLRRYAEDEDTWITKSAEWAETLDEYDHILEVAADLLDVRLPRLPYGSVRHLRPEDRTEIERLVRGRVASARG